jgi:Zn-finger protein
MRKGELFSIKLKNIQFDENGTVITIPDTRTTKTGERRIRVIFATPYLREWIEVHPCKNDRDSVLFCSLREPYLRLTDEGLRDQLVKIADKAEIKKRVNAHSFRHARATYLAEHLTEQQLKKYLGWTEGSTMAAIYVHLSGKDIDNAILKMYGMESEERKEDLVLKSMKCPRCGAIQDARKESCSECWLSFRVDAVEKSELELLKEEMERMKAENKDLISEIMVEKHIDEENLQLTIEYEVQKRLSEPDKDLQKLLAYFQKQGIPDLFADEEPTEAEKKAAKKSDW